MKQRKTIIEFSCPASIESGRLVAKIDQARHNFIKRNSAGADDKLGIVLSYVPTTTSRGEEIKVILDGEDLEITELAGRDIVSSVLESYFVQVAGIAGILKSDKTVLTLAERLQFADNYARAYQNTLTAVRNMAVNQIREGASLGDPLLDWAVLASTEFNKTYQQLQKIDCSLRDQQVPVMLFVGSPTRSEDQSLGAGNWSEEMLRYDWAFGLGKHDGSGIQISRDAQDSRVLNATICLEHYLCCYGNDDEIRKTVSPESKKLIVPPEAVYKPLICRGDLRIGGEAISRAIVDNGLKSQLPAYNSVSELISSLKG